MGIEFIEKLEEERTVVRTAGALIGNAEGWDVYVSLPDSSSPTEISIAQSDWNRLRLGLLKMYPRNVSDLEILADKLPTLLRQIADGLRQRGITDLRSRWEKTDDEILARFAPEVAACPTSIRPGEKA